MKAAYFLRGESAAFCFMFQLKLISGVMQNEPPRHDELKIDSMAPGKFLGLAMKKQYASTVFIPSAIILQYHSN
jgi:hypothetical protein